MCAQHFFASFVIPKLFYGDTKTILWWYENYYIVIQNYSMVIQKLFYGVFWFVTSMMFSDSLLLITSLMFDISVKCVLNTFSLHSWYKNKTCPYKISENLTSFSFFPLSLTVATVPISTTAIPNARLQQPYAFFHNCSMVYYLPNVRANNLSHVIIITC